MNKKSEMVKIPKESYKEVRELQTSLYEEYDVKAHIGEIIKHLIEKSKESAENLTEWLRDSIKEEKDKKKVINLSEI